MNQLTYKSFQPGQEKMVSDLVWEVFLEFEAPDYSPEGVETFKAFITPEKLANEVKNNGYKIYCCFDGDIPVGVIALRNITHISLLFVKHSHHKRGIAKRLLEISTKELLQKYSSVREITVNSSPYAVEIYMHLGFTPVSEQQEKDGIKYIPMKKSLLPSGR